MAHVSDVKSATVVEPPRHGLADLVRQIRVCTREASDPATIAKLVADALAKAKPSPSLLTEQERAGSPDGYTRHTLHTEAAFSISAVVWRPEQVTEIHDHLVWCSFMVIQAPRPKRSSTSRAVDWSRSAAATAQPAQLVVSLHPTTSTKSRTPEMPSRSRSTCMEPT
jgi:predicted metal-dependent enzyme (double-stranded beta helix superfamily)